MAPVMLPNASVSLRLRTHRIEFTFSGNSVAIGMIISDSSNAEMPMMGAAASTPWMKPLRADHQQAQAQRQLHDDEEQVLRQPQTGQHHGRSGLGGMAFIHQFGRRTQGQHHVDEVNQHHDESECAAHPAFTVRNEHGDEGQQESHQEEIEIALEAGLLRGEVTLNAAFLEHSHTQQGQRQGRQHQAARPEWRQRQFLR